MGSGRRGPDEFNPCFFVDVELSFATRVLNRWNDACSSSTRTHRPCWSEGNENKKTCGDFAMDILNDLFASIWSLLNNTVGHQAANEWNSLLWAIGFYTN